MMVTRMNNISIYVLNLESATSFYVDKLGCQVRSDIVIDPNTHWLLVCPPDQPDLQLLLIPVENGAVFTGEQARKMRELIGQQLFSYGVFKCRNLKDTYQALKAKGVRFLTAPGDGFLGQYEAAFVDDSGNWFRLTQDGDAV
ncbi:MAG: VOC family protein [Cytophagales bacterium]|nr:VOC family protein [Cytophagales bacterium]